MERIIRVTGRGNVSIAPDRIRIQITATGVRAEYKGAIEKTAEETGEVREAITEAGLAPKDLKTESLRIDSEYNEYRDEKDRWQREFVGYRFTHRMHIEFANDNKALGRVLGELTRCPANVEFQIRHTISNPERAKDALLENAVADAVKKAKVLAQASGAQLGNIISIDHSWGEVDIYSERVLSVGVDEPVLYNKGPLNLNIEADDIDLNDTVTVMWTLS